jgi:hypothetical protein
MSRKLFFLLAASSDPELIALAAARPLALPTDATADLPGEIVWMPAGTHEISCFTGAGAPVDATVLCDEAGGNLIAASFAAILGKGQRVYLDKDHKDEEATAWVTGFRWDPAQGIMAKVNWTSLGQELLRGKVYYSFSPAFFVNPKTSRVTRLPAGHAAGGLVNAPAFGAAMPALIAARLAGAETTNPASGGPRNINQNPVMNKETLIKILAALAVPVPADATDDQLTALVAKHVDKLPTAGAEGVALKAQLAELQSLKAKEAELETLKAKDAQRRKDDAKALVNAAVARGALPPKDEVLQAKWTGLIEADPKHAELLAALPGATVLTRVTQPGVFEVKDGVLEVLRAYKAKCGATKAHAQECAAIYAKDIRNLFADPAFQLLPLLAANSLGSLAGNLILQRSLTLLKLRFPALFAITTDFSDNPISFGQTVMTRLRTVPTVQSYDPTAGGYDLAAGASSTTIDVPIVINAHQFVPISFNANELAETKRDLFGEQVEGAFYAVAKDFWDAIMSLVTVAHFPHETAIAASSFCRDTLQTVDEAFLGRGVPSASRFAMLNGSAFHALGKDASIVQMAAFQAEFKGLLTQNVLPPVAGFQPYQVGNIPTGENLIGFCGTPDCLAVAARLPNDYTQAMGDVPATAIIEQVTNPDTGFSMMLVKYLDHRAGTANWRAAYMRGQAVGQAPSMQRLVSSATASGGS